MNGRRRGNGFTLIELLVVMVIIASLLMVAVPRYMNSLERSKEAVLMQDLAVMREAIDQFYADRGRYPDALVELSERRYIRKVPVDPITKSAESWVLVSREGGDIPGVFDIRSGADGSNSKGIPYAEL